MNNSLDCKPYCFYKLFNKCNGLINTPSILSSNNLAPYCYAYMFENCENIKKAPSLPCEILK
jgi:hypothetical protein